MNTTDPSYLAPRVGSMAQVADIRRLVVDDGKGRGMRVLEVDNGSGLSFTLYPDRGMDIGRARYRGTPLAWLSRNQEVSPQFYDAQGFEWLRTWGGGLLTGCGLANVGGPNEAGGEAHGLHGRLSHIPAEEVNTSAGWSADGAYTLSASGRVRHSKVFGENLVLTRRVSTVHGEAAITVRDTIENQGFAPSPLMLLYHLNLGWPLVDEGAVLEAPAHEVVPQNEHAAQGLADWQAITAPVPGFREQVYYHALPADAEGMASIRLVNRRLGLAFKVSYRVAELPYLVQWKMMGQGEYVVGLEPANCYPEGQERAAQRGLLRQLAAGERIETLLRLAVEPSPARPGAPGGGRSFRPPPFRSILVAMFLPCTAAEIEHLGWDAPDVILVSGDAYIDSPFSGTAVIGRVLTAAGFRVAVIAQPAVSSHDDIRRLGQPRLFWGVSSGCVDSMVANYTATGKKRHQDDFTPGGENTARPDRAVIAYCNLIRAAFKPCKPIVIGGIEASLRRIAHYDFWSDTVRRPVLFDAKADILVYGMAERVITALARALRDGLEWRSLRGLCYALPAASEAMPKGALALPDFATVAAQTDAGKAAFLDMFRLFAANQEPRTAKPLVQRVDTRCLVHNPPDLPLSPAELDAVYSLPYMLDVHPSVAAKGKVRALDTIRFSITTHRGCYGECNFCAIAMHQGRRVVSRTEASVLEEAHRFTRHPKFTGIIQDVGGPTANMYGFECERKAKQGACPDKRCLYPSCCPGLNPNHTPQLELLKKLRHIPGVRKVFVASGIRPDLVAADARNGARYVDELTAHHVSGQLKLAPEHSEKRVLDAMGKPHDDALLCFKERFDAANKKHGLKQFLTYYFIAAHPECSEEDMRALKRFATQNLHLSPEQVQIFTPTPSTWSTVMYYTGLNPFTGRPAHVTRGLRAKQDQKDLLVPTRPGA